jgi:hypothetical protein
MTPLLKRSREKSENSDATTAHGLVGVEDLEDPAHLDRHDARLARRDELAHESKCRVLDQPRERPAPAGYSDRDAQ